MLLLFVGFGHDMAGAVRGEAFKIGLTCGVDAAVGGGARECDAISPAISVAS